MADTGGERITDTFRFKHHALILVPEIKATNRIINATTRLATAIAGIQEAPPDKLEAIQSLRIFLLGEVALLPYPAPIILPTPPVITPTFDDKPITIWNPQEGQTSPPLHEHNTPNISPNSNTPAIIEDDSDDNTPTPVHSKHPPQHHRICPSQKRPLTCNQLRLRTAHIINCIIADELMPTPSLCTHQPSIHLGYAFAAQSILLETTSLPSHSTIHFISAIIDNNTSDVLEY
jgi:hypothetical protein